MIYQPNWEKIQSRMLSYWNRESVDRCCASFEVRKPGYVDFSGNFYFETEKATEMFRKRFENTTYYADAFPFLFPYFGTAGIAEYTGCKPNRVPETTWFDHWMEDMDEPDAELIRYSHPDLGKMLGSGGVDLGNDPIFGDKSRLRERGKDCFCLFGHFHRLASFLLRLSCLTEKFQKNSHYFTTNFDNAIVPHFLQIASTNIRPNYIFGRKKVLFWTNILTTGSG